MRKRQMLRKIPGPKDFFKNSFFFFCRKIKVTQTRKNQKRNGAYHENSKRGYLKLFKGESAKNALAIRAANLLPVNFCVVKNNKSANIYCVSKMVFVAYVLLVR